VEEQEMNTQQAQLDRDTIARRAYEIYLQRGCQDGHDQDDWYKAEAELGARNPQSKRTHDNGSRPEAAARAAGTAKTVRSRAYAFKK
jgi:hypothetical protein